MKSLIHGNVKSFMDFQSNALDCWLVEWFLCYDTPKLLQTKWPKDSSLFPFNQDYDCF